MSGAQNHHTPHGKTLAAVHFNTVPCQANIDNGHMESHIFAKFVPVLTTLCMLGLKFLELLCAFQLGFSNANNNG